MEIVRCMLRNIPKFLWGEAVSTAIYTLNRCPIKEVKDKSPYEVWRRRKPNIYHFRIFDCEFSYIISNKRKKIDDKLEKYIFISYDSQYQGYRLYSLSSNECLFLGMLSLMKLLMIPLQVKTLTIHLKKGLSGWTYLQIGHLKSKIFHLNKSLEV